MSQTTVASTAAANVVAGAAVARMAASLTASRDLSDLGQRLALALPGVTGSTGSVVALGDVVAAAGLSPRLAVSATRQVRASGELSAAAIGGLPFRLEPGVDRETDGVLATLAASAATLVGIDDGDEPGFLLLVGPPAGADTTTVAAIASLVSALAARLEESRRLADQAAIDVASGLLTWAGLERAAGQTTGPGLVTMDVLGLTELAAGFGAASARSVVRDIGARLAAVPGVQAVATISPERLAVLIDGDASALGDQVVAVAAEPVQAGRHRLVLRVHAGAAGGARGTTLRALFERAELARVEATTRGVAVVVHTATLSEGCNQRLQTVGWLWKALQQDKLVVFYQPQVDADGALLAYEALVRWQREDGTMVPPDAFLPVAEQAGMMGDIDLYVLGKACHQLKIWEDEGHTGFRLAVNLSASTVSRPGIDVDVLAVIEREGIDPRRLEIEITETAAATEDGWARVLEAFRSAGITIALDDFGSGFSSLGRIHRLPLDRLKIDRAFVADLDGAGRTLVRAVVTLAEGLGLAVLAEGVEDAAQHQALVALGVTELQGYYFGRPQPACDIAG